MKVKFTLCFFLFISVVQAFAAWSGGKEQPSTKTIDGKSYYAIANANQLAWFAAEVNGGHNAVNAILTANIVMGDDETKTCGKSWTPIGSSTYPFKGSFDGAGFSIYGLNVNTSSGGLFRNIGQGGVVKAFRLRVGNVTGSGYVGSVAASNEGLIYNVGNYSVKVSSTVSSGSAPHLYAGGIVASNKGEIRYSFNRASVSAKANIASNNSVEATGYAGGIAALNENLIWNSENFAWVVSQITIYTGVASTYAGGVG